MAWLGCNSPHLSSNQKQKRSSNKLSFHKHNKQIQKETMKYQIINSYYDILDKNNILLYF